MNRNYQTHKRIKEIFASTSPEIYRLAEGFHYILKLHLAETRREMELLQAMGDRGQLVKEQIKHNTIQHAISVFDDCYFKATGNSWLSKQESPPEDGDE